ncbi:AAA family ATPase [Candidatus Bathyarchaeota archaeon]|nr:AAA family ATPase [Candidatus Bathyarchaeota archaeon]
MNQVMRENDSAIFKDQKKLAPTYIPRNLLHREEQIQELNKIYRPGLNNIHESYLQVVRVVGPVGSGKTCTVTWFKHIIQDIADRQQLPLKVIYVNCKSMARNPRSLYKIIYEKATGKNKQNYSREEFLTQLISHLKETKKYIFIILDDIDYLLATTENNLHDGGVVYDLSRLNELTPGEPDNVLGLILVGREGLTEYLVPCEKSSLGLLKIKLSAYDRNQLREIIARRSRIAFKTDCVSKAVLDYVADLSAGRQTNPGDCRFALDLLYFSGIKADQSLSSKITLEHVRSVYSVNLHGPSVEVFKQLGTDYHIVIWAIIHALEGAKANAYKDLHAVNDYCRAECEEKDRPPLSYSKVREIIIELDMLEVVLYKKGKGVGIAGTSLKKLKQKLKTMEKLQ